MRDLAIAGCAALGAGSISTILTLVACYLRAVRNDRRQESTS